MTRRRRSNDHVQNQTSMPSHIIKRNERSSVVLQRPVRAVDLARCGAMLLSTGHLVPIVDWTRWNVFSPRARGNGVFTDELIFTTIQLTSVIRKITPQWEARNTSTALPGGAGRMWNELSMLDGMPDVAPTALPTVDRTFRHVPHFLCKHEYTIHLQSFLFSFFSKLTYTPQTSLTAIEATLRAQHRAIPMQG